MSHIAWDDSSLGTNITEVVDLSVNPDIYLETDAELDVPETLSPGTIIAERYRIDSVVGKGGMGVVYKAHQIHMDRVVALKMMLQQSTLGSQDYRRFKREAQAASLLDHPNIVTIHDFDYADGRAYLSMDYLEGASLDQCLLDKTLTLDQFRHIFSQACAALQHAHDKGIVHRDLKPSNLMITERRGDQQFLVILDFGLVKMMEAAGTDHKLTVTNMVLGSPLYMSPEQCRAVGIDHRSDIYSLGCVMYEALTGIPPLHADSIFDQMSKHISETPRPMREVVPGLYVPPALERLIFQAMAKTAAERPQSMKELADAIEAVFSGAPDLVLVAKPNSFEDLSSSKRKKKRKYNLTLTTAVWGALLFLLPMAWLVNSSLHHNSTRKHFIEKTATAPQNTVISNLDSGSEARLETKKSPTEFAAFVSLGGLPRSKADASLLPVGSPLSSPLNNSPITNPIFSSPASSNLNPSSSSSSPPLAVLPVKLPLGSLIPPVVPLPKTVEPPAEVNVIESSTRSKAPNSEEQVLYEGDLAFRTGDYSQAKNKYEALIGLKGSIDTPTPVLAKLVVCSYALKDPRTVDCLNRFKDAYAFDANSMTNEGALLVQVLSISRLVSDREDLTISEKLLLACIDCYNRQKPQPDADTLRLKMDLSKVYNDQGRPSECEDLLQRVVQEAQSIPVIRDEAQSHLDRIQEGRRVRITGGGPPQGGFGGPNGGGPGGFAGGRRGGGPMGRDGRSEFGGPR